MNSILPTLLAIFLSLAFGLPKAGASLENSLSAPKCGQPVSVGALPTVADALGIVRAAVGLAGCSSCVCDLNGDGSVRTSDALQALVAAVEAGAEEDRLQCPRCSQSDPSLPLCEAGRMGDFRSGTAGQSVLPLELQKRSCLLPCDGGAAQIQDLLMEACLPENGHGEGLYLGFDCDTATFDIDDQASTWNPNLLDNCRGLRLSGEGSEIQFRYTPGCKSACVGLCSNSGDRCPDGPDSSSCCLSDDPNDPLCASYQCVVDSNCAGAANVCDLVAPTQACQDDVDCGGMDSSCRDGRCRLLDADSCETTADCSSAGAVCAADLARSCPNIDRGRTFLDLGGDNAAQPTTSTGHDNVIEFLAVEDFFNGIMNRGDRNSFRALQLRGQCDESFSNAASASGTRFESVFGSDGSIAAAAVLADGCDKCAQDSGDRRSSSPDQPEFWNVTYDGVSFEDCAKPWRITDSSIAAVTGRFRALRSTFTDSDLTDSVNSCSGPELTMSGYVEISESLVEGCVAGLQLGGGTQALLRGNVFRDNILRGVVVFRNSHVRAEGNLFEGNGVGDVNLSNKLGIQAHIGIHAVSGAGEPRDAQGAKFKPRLDLGGGAVSIDGSVSPSAGGNRFQESGGLSVAAPMIENRTGRSVKAERNCWATDSRKSRVVGPVDTTPASGLNADEQCR
jgi:hypothetical protein